MLFSFNSESLVTYLTFLFLTFKKFDHLYFYAEYLLLFSFTFISLITYFNSDYM